MNIINVAMAAVFSFPFLTFAGELHDGVKVLKNGENQLMVRASCAYITKAIAGLPSVGSIKKVKGSKSHYCEADISKSVHPKMLELHDTFARNSGPNCWNTSTYLAGISQFRRAVIAEEMDFVTSSPICHQLGPNESPRYGDIIAIHGQGTPAEMHGFTYLNNVLAFSKAGSDKQFGYEVVSGNYVFETFALGKAVSKPECRKVTGVPNENQCPVYAQFFRCQTYKKYLAEADFQSKGAYKSFDRFLTSVEALLSEFTVGDHGWSRGQSETFRAQLKGLQATAKANLLSIRSEDAMGKFFWKYADLRIESLFVQIDLLNHEALGADPTEKLMNFFKMEYQVLKKEVREIFH